MLQDINTLFDEKQIKTEILTLRVSKNQRERINQMAGHKSINAFILSLLAQENEKQIHQAFDVF